MHTQFNRFEPFRNRTADTSLPQNNAIDEIYLTPKADSDTEHLYDKPSTIDTTDSNTVSVEYENPTYARRISEISAEDRIQQQTTTISEQNDTTFGETTAEENEYCDMGNQKENSLVPAQSKCI